MITPRNIFLLDGVGALLSAAFTGLVLPLLPLGLPLWIFYGLAIFPLVYAIYSLVCYSLVRTILPWMIRAIIIANLLYCVVSAAVILTFPGVWARLLLAGEIFIIVGVVLLEINVLHFSFQSHKEFSTER